MRLSFIYLLFMLLSFVFASAAILLRFRKDLYNRLSVRIIMLVLMSGLVALLIALAFSEITLNTFVTPLTRLFQVAFLILGGPVVLGLLTVYFVRRPLRQFNDAVASLEKNNYRVQLQETGIREFDEVFIKFNNLINRLHDEEKLRKDLVSDTSHELNTPLAAMIGQLTAIQEGKHPATKERITILKEEAERLADLIQQLDAYAKARIPDAGEPEVIPLKQFCEELLSRFSVELKQNAMSTRLDIPDDYTLHANRDALQRILTNLLQNTLRYSEAKEITITATADQLLFTDNGKGVPSESLPYLFERFYRVDKSRSRVTGGLGLGLAIVKELVEQQGWQIHAEHAHPGVTFVLTLKQQARRIAH